jgi:predicted dehydrogenase/nucleoside-diphosphate-sugar epimerase
MLLTNSRGSENGIGTLAQQPMGQELRVAIVGSGKMAVNHARAVASCSIPARVVAVADPSEIALAAMRSVAPDAKQFASLTELLAAGGVDVVHICTPPASHVPLAIEALEAGRHIYVEKPFAESSRDAERILGIAKDRGLKVAAGHQLLHEKPTRVAAELLPSLGRISHIESYFSFRTVRRVPGGRVPLASDLQLLDILPHPVYLLLHFLNLSGAGRPELLALDIGEGGTVHALIKQGHLTGSLVVTLEGRPVESYMRIVGTNGALHADYIRGTVQRQIGPGTSGIDKVLSPFRIAEQLIFGTTAALGARAMNRQRSYPGLVELFDAFYGAVQTGGPSPVTNENILETTRLCEQVASGLRSAKREHSETVVRPAIRSGVLVTGGTGSLGAAVVKELVAAGREVRAVSRREPARWERVVGAEYVAADLSRPLPATLFQGIDSVIHTAAETAGSWNEHQRNSIDATDHVIRSAAGAGVKRVVHVSSVAVLGKPAGRGLITDETALASQSRSFGPYVWGKLESERLAVELGRTLGIGVKIARPGPLVDFVNFEAPGRLGRRIGNVFVAVGMPRDRLSMTEVGFAARVLIWMLDSFDSAPDKLNLLDPNPPTKRDAIQRLRQKNPDLTVAWLPMSILAPLSWLAVVGQKVARPRKSAMNIAKAFASPKYDTSRMKAVVSQMKGAIAVSPQTTNRADAIGAMGADGANGITDLKFSAYAVEPRFSV